MIGRLRTAHQHRFELPLLSAPVEFEPRCADGSVCPRPPAGRRLPYDQDDAELLHRRPGAGRGPGASAGRHRAAPEEPRSTTSCTTLTGQRGGVDRRQPGHGRVARARACGDNVLTKFVPERVPAQRSLDPARQCSRGFSTATAARSSSAVGPAASSTRPAPSGCATMWSSSSARWAGSRTGVGGRRRAGARAGQRPSGPPPSDAFIMDIRLPAGIEPFRLQRKRDLYQRDGGGRPMRFVRRRSSRWARRRPSASRSLQPIPSTSPTTSWSRTTRSTTRSSSSTRRRTRARSR